MTQPVRTWHHGLVARWWAEFNQGGADLEFFQHALAESGEPVLDAGCGTGRLLIPFRRAGIDADGSDASPDMLKWCASQANAEGLMMDLYPQSMHQLDLPRHYQTIVVCGAFGIGASRSQDMEGLRRIRAHLLPGGTLVMDHYLPYLENPRSWPFWVKRPELPLAWPKRGDRRTASDGTELELRTRMVAFDPLEQTTTLEIKAIQHVDGEETRAESNEIDINLYFKNELLLMLELAGYRDIRVTGFPEHRAARSWEDARIVYFAKR